MNGTALWTTPPVLKEGPGQYVRNNLSCKMAKRNFMCVAIRTSQVGQGLLPEWRGGGELAMGTNKVVCTMTGFPTRE